MKDRYVFLIGLGTTWSGMLILGVLFPNAILDDKGLPGIYITIWAFLVAIVAIYTHSRQEEN